MAKYARGGQALEFAIGTGRIALPLADHGVRVDGTELSPHMVAKLREKPGGDSLDLRVGDMASETTDETYPLVYLVFNTPYNVLTQDGQIECFKNAARHLDEDGVFVVEAAPPWAWVRGDQFVNVKHITADSVTFDVSQYDHVTQVLDENHVSLGPDGISMGPISCSPHLAVRDGPDGSDGWPASHRTVGRVERRAVYLVKSLPRERVRPELSARRGARPPTGDNRSANDVRRHGLRHGALSRPPLGDRLTAVRHEGARSE